MFPTCEHLVPNMLSLCQGKAVYPGEPTWKDKTELNLVLARKQRLRNRQWSQKPLPMGRPNCVHDIGHLLLG